MRASLAGLVKTSLLAVALTAGGCASVPASTATARVQEDLGVEFEALRLSAAGYMLDLRYRVIDAEKAKPLFERKVRPVLLDEATGARVGVPDTPKLGQLRSSTRNVKAGRTYSILFANPGRMLERGTRVTLLAGSSTRIEGLRIE